MNKTDRLKPKSRELFELIKKAKTVAIAGHIHPDGDCLGAMLGLKHYLENQGKEVTVLADCSDVPENYSFLPGFDSITEKPPFFVYDLFIAVDVPNSRRLGRFQTLFKQAKYTANIDHHPDNEQFADVNIVFEDFSSTSEIVFWLFRYMNVKINFDIAECLYVGIVTDTGRFQYSNTGPSTFDAARQLVEAGVVPVAIFRKVYENIKPEVLRLLGVVLERVKNQDGFFWSYFTREDLERYGVSAAETENFVDYIRSIRGVRVAALFKSITDEQKWKVSLRSRGEVNVQKLSARFNGGGHYEAAGCEVSGSLDEAVELIFRAYKEQINEAEVG